MPQLSDVSLVILPGSEQGLAQAEVSFEANFSKQEHSQKLAHALSIALFAVYDEGELPEPAMGSFSPDPAQAYGAVGQGQPSPLGGPAGRSAWRGPGSGGPSPYGPTGHAGYGSEAWPQPQRLGGAGGPGPWQGQGYGQAGFGPQGYPYGQPGAFPGSFPGAGHAPFGPGPHGHGPARYDSAGYGGNGYGGNGYGGNGYGSAAGAPYAPVAAAQPYARPTGLGQARRADAYGSGEHRSAERFLFWVCRELIVPTAAPLAIQRRVLFDPYTFLHDTPLMRTYVWLLPERTEGRSWSNLAQIPRAA